MSSSVPRPMSVLERSVLGSRPETDRSEIDVLVEEIADLQPLPPIAAQVLQIAEGETFSAHELAQAISSDPALTARVLRVANSAYYGFPRRITTIRDAVVLLGFRQVRSTLLATSVMRSMPSYDGIDAFAFWRHAVSVGLLAELTARAEGTHQEEAFTAGVLHNVGRLALEQARPAEFVRARDHARDLNLSMHDAQQYLFGFTDADVGAALARHWRFPVDLSLAIEHHANPRDAIPESAGLARLVARARTFAMTNGITDGVDTYRACAASRGRQAAAFRATMSVMSPDDLPARADAHPSRLQDALERLVAQEGGLETVLDRAAAFVEHTAAAHLR
jgi:HD-like signal output (HDOD) protein